MTSPCFDTGGVETGPSKSFAKNWDAARGGITDLPAGLPFVTTNIRSAFGTVNTHWRCGTGASTAASTHAPCNGIDVKITVSRLRHAVDFQASSPVTGS